MGTVIGAIKNLLLKIVNDIDCGNSNIDETDAVAIIEALKRYTDKDIIMSKY